MFLHNRETLSLEDVSNLSKRRKSLCLCACARVIYDCGVNQFKAQQDK